MSHSAEWSCSEWIASDDLFLHIGRYWYPLHINQIVDCAVKAVEIIADALSKLAESVRQSIQNLMDTLPNICIERVEDAAEQYEMELRTRWKPVRYIHAADRRTDRRPLVHHIRSALPQMHRDRRTRKEPEYD